jgi:hypothetical protein
MSHCWGSLAVLMLNFLIDHCLDGIILLILILSVRPGLRCIMWSVLQFSCHAWFLFCVYIYICKQYWKSVPIYCLLEICPQAKCPHAFFYWQRVPMHFLVAICPHACFIGKVSQCILYWQSVPMHFYWQSVPMHFVLAICPHALFIGKASPYIFYPLGYLVL